MLTKKICPNCKQEFDFFEVSDIAVPEIIPGEETICPDCASKIFGDADEPKNDAEKRCSRCGIVHGISAFPRNKKTKDGHGSWCRICINAYYEKRRLTGKGASLLEPITPKMQIPAETESSVTGTESKSSATTEKK
jgi:DNA-directed RNA polymerase subunit RPC12/RpoP